MDLIGSDTQEFSRGNFDCAKILYTKTMEFCPVNHLLYGNRALCLILTQQAVVLKPNWPKGHYHFCKALLSLGEGFLCFLFQMSLSLLE
uniref:Uncharacterized protein n=1 Tax=Amazona collaria TaxID=241587 RepID=A0A8B9GGF8_9PSIT